MNIKVTNKLAEILKEERKNNTISAKNLSFTIDKSPTYISTLERGNIKNIDSELLYNLIRKLKICSDVQLNDYINDIAYKSFVDAKFNKKAFKSEKWIYQLTLYLRQTPIDICLSNIIKDETRNLEVTGRDLVRKINSNDCLENIKDMKYDELVVDENGNWSFKYKINDNFVDDIIEGNVKTCNYVNMYAIIFNIYLLQGDDFVIANKKVEQLLVKYNFLGLSDIVKTKQQFIENKIKGISNDEYNFELFSMEKEKYYNNLKNIKEHMDYLIASKPDTAIVISETVSKNLNLDSEFMNVIFRIPFGTILKNVNKEGKQEFLNKMSELMTSIIDNYKEGIIY